MFVFVIFYKSCAKNFFFLNDLRKNFIPFLKEKKKRDQEKERERVSE